MTELYGEGAWAAVSTSFATAFEGRTVSDERRLIHGGASARGTRAMVLPDFGDDGSVAGIYAVTIDVHELTEVQQRLQRTVERDGLTDALTRRTMMERLGATARASPTQPVALFFVDLDGFRALNDPWAMPPATPC